MSHFPESHNPKKRVTRLWLFSQHATHRILLLSTAKISQQVNQTMSMTYTHS